MYVVDASVWVSSLLVSDVNHASAANWIERAIERRISIYEPAVLLPEVAGAVSRVSGDPAAGIRGLRSLLLAASVRILTQDRRSYDEAARLASDLRIRGCDALYVQVAADRDLTLVSFDEQQLERSLSVVDARRPGEVELG